MSKYYNVAAYEQLLAWVLNIEPHSSPDGAFILNTRTSDFKRNQFLSILTKLGERFTGKAHM